MPKRSDLKSILIIGAGPIIIGQACELITPAFKPVALCAKRATRSF